MAKADNVVSATLKETIITGAVTKSYAALSWGGEIKSTAVDQWSVCNGAPGGETIKLGWSAERTVVLQSWRWRARHERRRHTRPGQAISARLWRFWPLVSGC